MLVTTAPLAEYTGLALRTIVNFFVFCMLELPLADVLARPFWFGPKGANYAIVFAEAAIATAGVLLFRRGKWKRQQI